MRAWIWGSKQPEIRKHQSAGLKHVRARLLIEETVEFQAGCKPIPAENSGKN
jgi:hypothetical protein